MRDLERGMQLGIALGARPITDEALRLGAALPTAQLRLTTEPST
jgi:hypothetical protein